MTIKRIVASRLFSLSALAVAALALGLAPADQTAAQGARGVAQGRVVDAAGNPLKGVSVKLTYIQIKTIGKSAGFDPDQAPEMLLVKTVGTQVSDEEGKITFQNLEPRQYTASAYSAGAGNGEVNVQVEGGKTASFELKLAKNR